MAFPRPRGVCRIRCPPGMEDDVRVTDGTITFGLLESQYCARQYDPPPEQLPWCPDSAVQGTPPNASTGQTPDKQ
jgi:hypothetical protein